MNLAVPGLELRVVADPAPEIGMPAKAAVALATFSSRCISVTELEEDEGAV
jgi:hypothetical protein